MMSQPASASTSACLHQHLDGLVVEDGAVAQQPVMAVAGIGIERDVAEDADLRHLLLDRAYGAADQIVRIERFAAVLVAQLRVGIGKEREAGDGELGALARRRARASSTDSRSTPGMEATGMRALVPSTRNSGQIRSSAVSTFSRDHAPRPFGLAVAARTGGEVEAGGWASPRPGRDGLRSGGRI